MARQRNDATMRSVCAVEVHVTANNIKTSSVAFKKLFYGEFMSPRTVKRTLVFM